MTRDIATNGVILEPWCSERRSLMMIPVPAREAPAPPPLARLDSGQTDPARPPVPDEPLLAMDTIQGNSVAGFNKDFQTLLFLKIVDVPDFKRWLKALIPFIATAS